MKKSTGQQSEARSSAREKLLAAAISLIRAKGYTATAVDEVCAVAGVSKGAFFHHFKSKEALAVEAAEFWSQMTGALFASAPYHGCKDPADRLLAYIEFRRALIAGRVPEFTCLVGTMVQETYDTHPEIREACNRSIAGHAGSLVDDIAEAARERGIDLPCTPESLAFHTQAVIQGAFIVAKAENDSRRAIESLDHLKRYFACIFRLSEVAKD